MTRYVLLRHELPDGSWHFDWLMDPGGAGQDPDERRLIAFRTPQPPESVDASRFVARRMPDHRLLYLEFEGPLSGTGRGAVQRVIAGLCEIHRRTDRRIEVTLHPPGRSPVSLVGESMEPAPGVEPNRWEFRPLAPRTLEQANQPIPAAGQMPLGNSHRDRR